MSELKPYLDAFRAQTEPDEARVARLRHGRNGTNRLSWWCIAAPLAGAAVAWLVLAAPPQAPPPQPVAQAWSGGGPTFNLAPHVRVDANGHGEATGDSTDIGVRWVSGDVTFTVTPGHGVALRVETAEAAVVVTGTVFTVRRDAYGTAVAVQRGEVEARCGEAPAMRLGPGDATLCPPIDAVGWLRRVTALQQAGRPAEVVGAVDGALALVPEPAIELELRLQRVMARGELGQSDRARAELAAMRDRFPEAATRLDRVRRNLPVSEQ